MNDDVNDDDANDNGDINNDTVDIDIAANDQDQMRRTLIQSGLKSTL